MTDILRACPDDEADMLAILDSHSTSARGLPDSSSAVRSFCDRCLAGIYVIREGTIRYVNAAFAQILGCAASSMIGEPATGFVHPDDRDLVETLLRRGWEHPEQSARFEMRCLTTKGDVVYFEALASPLDLGGPAVMIAAVDITARRQAECRTESFVLFERLLADLSACFVNVSSEQLDPLIHDSLQKLVNFLGNDRSTLVEFDNDDRHLQVTHSYAIPGCEPFPLGKMASDRLPWFIRQFRSGNTVFVANIPDDLPPEAATEREYCAQHGIKSNVALPLRAGGCVIGGITFAFLTRPCEWPKEIISRLQLIGEVFASALMRRRADEELKAVLAENQKLRERLEEENLYLREQSILNYQHGKIIGRSPAITRVLSDVERVAVTDAPVLLLGETGTGKELLAQTIHELSKRKSQPMVIVNCASLPATLVESELFGRAAGAYTGAASAQAGRFGLADGSTLFLDEIGEFPIELQAKLLRVLQDGRFERLGSPNTVSVDVRIIAATNRNLKQAVQDGKFRADLYHRLNVFPIHLPPLRQRREDIPQLVWAFAEVFGRRMGKSIKKISRTTIQQLQSYSWPGNVRELSNVVERAMILTSDDALRLEVPVEAEKEGSPRATLKQAEQEQILGVLQDTGWRIRGAGGAAEILGIKPTTLEARMAKLGIRRPSSSKLS